MWFAGFISGVWVNTAGITRLLMQRKQVVWREHGSVIQHTDVSLPSNVPCSRSWIMYIEHNPAARRPLTVLDCSNAHATIHTGCVGKSQCWGCNLVMTTRECTEVERRKIYNHTHTLCWLVNGDAEIVKNVSPPDFFQPQKTSNAPSSSSVSPSVPSYSSSLSLPVFISTSTSFISTFLSFPVSHCWYFPPHLLPSSIINTRGTEFIVFN